MSDEQRASAREDLAAGTNGDSGASRTGDSEPDLMADTERFRRFARHAEPEQPVEIGGGEPVGVPFRLLTLGLGIVALVVLIWLLFL